MVNRPSKIVWSKRAKANLKKIHAYYFPKSKQGAKKLIRDIVLAGKRIVFLKQYQVDEILGEPYHRLVVRNYKVIYRIKDTTVIIIQIFDTRRSSRRLKD